MRAGKLKTAFLLCISCLVGFLPLTANAQGMKIPIADIYANPDKYDWRTVQVEGQVLSLRYKICAKGNYTTFKLNDNSGKLLTIFSYGQFPIQNDDNVKVTGIYKKVIHVPPHFTFYNEIDATTGSIVKIK